MDKVDVENMSKEKMVVYITEKISKMDRSGMINFIRDLFEVVGEKCEERDAARAKAQLLEKMLTDARITLTEAKNAFEAYADSHGRKGDVEKQARNAALASRMREVVGALEPVTKDWVTAEAFNLVSSAADVMHKTIADLERERDSAITRMNGAQDAAVNLFDEIKRRERVAAESAQGLIAAFGKLSIALVELPGAVYAVHDVRDALLRALNLPASGDKKEGGM